MNHDRRTETITRDTLLRLLSDDEIARVSTAETGCLAAGDEYVDLGEPDKGVCRADGSTTTPMGRVLPRAAVQERTWREIEILLAAHEIEAAGRSSS
jgi:hypothetical protein